MSPGDGEAHKYAVHLGGCPGHDTLGMAGLEAGGEAISQADGVWRMEGA